MTTPLALPFDAPLETSRRRKRVHVRETSVLAKQATEESRANRAEVARKLLVEIENHSLTRLTSAEMALCMAGRFAYAGQGRSQDWLILNMRRAISDLQRIGVAERVPGGDRKCNRTGRLCATWRLRQR